MNDLNKEAAPDPEGRENGPEREEKAPEREKKKKKKAKSPLLWALQIFILTFFLSLSFSVLSNLVSERTPLFVAFILLLFIIGVNILFDIVGVAAASCSVEPFLAMAAKKKKGARMAVRIAKNAEKVSNICADVIGDICGILSGALGASIVVNVVAKVPTWDAFLVSVLFSALIAALTVGGKALGKKYAMSNCQNIIFFVARTFSVFSRK